MNSSSHEAHKLANSLNSHSSPKLHARQTHALHPLKHASSRDLRTHSHLKLNGQSEWASFAGVFPRWRRGTCIVLAAILQKLKIHRHQYPKSQCMLLLARRGRLSFNISSNAPSLLFQSASILIALGGWKARGWLVDPYLAAEVPSIWWSNVVLIDLGCISTVPSW